MNWEQLQRFSKAITMMMVAFGSVGISISLPTGPVIATSSPGFKSPENSVSHPQSRITSTGKLQHKSFMQIAENII